MGKTFRRGNMDRTVALEKSSTTTRHPLWRQEKIKALFIAEKIIGTCASDRFSFKYINSYFNEANHKHEYSQENKPEKQVTDYFIQPFHSDNIFAKIHKKCL
jgi:predicted HD phosphohydrolase